MSQRSSQTFAIGGPVPADAVYDLAMLLDNFESDFGLPGEFDIDTPKKLLDAADGDVLEVYDHDTRGDEFDSLADFCVLHGIAYDRYVEDDGECTDFVIRWRPGMAEPVLRSTDGYHGQEVVDREPLRAIFADLAAALTSPLGSGEARRAISRAVVNGLTALGPDVPDLEPLTIEGTDAPVPDPARDG